MTQLNIKKSWPALVFQIIIIFAPLFFLALSPSLQQSQFRNEPIKRLRKRRPDFIFIGNSMLNSRIDISVLSRLSGNKSIVSIGPNASNSAHWYLRLKNHVVASGVKPRLIFFFFRDYGLTQPFFGVDQISWADFEETMTEEEPVFFSVSSKVSPGFKTEFENQRNYRFVTLSQKKRLRKEIRVYPFVLAGFGKRKIRRLSLRASIVTSYQFYRAETIDHLINTTHPEFPTFKEQLESSFLPHIIQLARENQLPLAFIKLKRRTESNLWQNAANLKSYTSDLESYIKSNGHFFHDFTHDKEIKPYMYAYGDHIDKKYRDQYTRLFYQRLSEKFK